MRKDPLNYGNIDSYNLLAKENVINKIDSIGLRQFGIFFLLKPIKEYFITF